MTKPDTSFRRRTKDEHKPMQDLHTALRRAIGAFSLCDHRCEMNSSHWPKWVKLAEKTLKELRKEEGTNDHD